MINRSNYHEAFGFIWKLSIYEIFDEVYVAIYFPYNKEFLYETNKIICTHLKINSTKCRPDILAKYHFYLTVKTTCSEALFISF